ncbi:hypothetical protein LOTGIDRAFT_239205 [Lottia gigantea]|uniref:GST C-terminal domain-containing protein n=1 Tax=Lottia gigantea TaxID=225164 RepID=V4AQK7_LOTGI|nr:hypothetical protein LOTGIDRAFT_239205 [Lottia gigantea]ESO97105.1 hypothetical protein LOTGIDRAFT_239205 [Lottia gigantea]
MTKLVFTKKKTEHIFYCIIGLRGDLKGLDGKNNIEKLQTDVIVEECIQIREDQFNAHFEKDETIKAEKQKKLTETTLPKILGFIEKALSENARGNGFVVGNQLTWADLALIDTMERLPDLLAKYPKISAHKKLVEGLPKLAAYINKRPKTDL